MKFSLATNKFTKIELLACDQDLVCLKKKLICGSFELQYRSEGGNMQSFVFTLSDMNYESVAIDCVKAKSVKLGTLIDKVLLLCLFIPVLMTDLFQGH